MLHIIVILYVYLTCFWIELKLKLPTRVNSEIWRVAKMWSNSSLEIPKATQKLRAVHASCCTNDDFLILHNQQAIVSRHLLSKVRKAGFTMHDACKHQLHDHQLGHQFNPRRIYRKNTLQYLILLMTNINETNGMKTENLCDPYIYS